MATVLSNRNPTDRNADATVHIGHLDEKVSDALLWELMVQAAPVRHVYIPRDRITGAHFGYAFCEFHTPQDAHYAAKILHMTQLYSKPIRISQATTDRRSQDVGANIFVGNLSEEADEKTLHDAFSAFGPIVDAPYIMRDPATNHSKRFAFIKFGAFEHSDAAIQAMDGQYICNVPIVVQYAFKKDGDRRERHGSSAERILAARAAEATAHAPVLHPHLHFADRPASEMRTQQHVYQQQPAMPNWQRAMPPNVPYPYPPYAQQFAYPQPPPTTQLGWSQARQFTRPPKNQQPYPVYTPMHNGDAMPPQLLDDDTAPPPPSAQ